MVEGGLRTAVSVRLERVVGKIIRYVQWGIPIVYVQRDASFLSKLGMCHVPGGEPPCIVCPRDIFEEYAGF